MQNILQNSQNIRKNILNKEQNNYPLEVNTYLLIHCSNHIFFCKLKATQIKVKKKM